MNHDIRLYKQQTRSMDFVTHPDMERHVAEQMQRYDIHRKSADEVLSVPYKGMYKGPKWLNGEVFFIRWTAVLFPVYGASSIAKLIDAGQSVDGNGWTDWPLTPKELGEVIFRWSRLWVTGFDLTAYNMQQLRELSYFHIAQFYEGLWDDEVREEFRDENDPDEAPSVEVREDVSRLLYLLNRNYQITKWAQGSKDEIDHRPWIISDGFVDAWMLNHPAIMGVESQHFMSTDKIPPRDNTGVVRRYGGCESLILRSLPFGSINRNNLSVSELQWSSAVVSHMVRLNEGGPINPCRDAVARWQKGRFGVTGKIRDMCQGITHTSRGGPFVPAQWTRVAMMLNEGSIVDRTGQLEVEDELVMIEQFAAPGRKGGELIPVDPADADAGFELFT